MISLSHTLRCGRLAAALTLALCAMPVHADEPAKSFADMVKELPLVPAGTYDSEMLARVTLAVDFIKRMELPQAHLAVNEALQLDPRNAHLHFLNGFVYHLLAMQGDTQKGEMALEGYQQALRIDPSNWIAREFLGLAYMDLKQFDRARLAFSDVLLMTPESTVSIYGLMVTSYLTGDARTACAMADQFRKVSAKLCPGRRDETGLSPTQRRRTGDRAHGSAPGPMEVFLSQARAAHSGCKHPCHPCRCGHDAD